jgi:hypothetical protein
LRAGGPYDFSGVPRVVQLQRPNISYVYCCTGTCEIRAWIEAAQQAFVHVKFLAQLLERALVHKAVELSHLFE